MGTFTNETIVETMGYLTEAEIAHLSSKIIR